VAADILFSVLIAVIVVSAAFFIPKWLYWITPYADSAYNVLAGQYGRKVALWVYVGLIAVFSVASFLLMATEYW
jgi:hypothetical protein